MDFRTQVTAPGATSRFNADALLIVLAGDKLPAGLDEPLAKAIEQAVALDDYAFKSGKLAYLRAVDGVKAPRVAVAHAANASAKALKAAAAAGFGALKGLGVKHVAIQLAGFGELQGVHAEAVAAAAGDAVYLYRTTKPSAPPAPKLEKLTLLAGTKAEGSALNGGFERAAAIVEGVTLARELANRPGNHCTPTILANEARKMAKANGLRIEVLDKKAIEAIGMGSFLAVAQGSDEPPRFIVMHYQGAAKSAAPVVLVGKGITFDTGGISLKPGAEMDEMKFDMGGAASVIGTMRAIAQLKPKLNVVGIVAATENMPGGRAVKPGDVVTSLSGQTIEILNTDAEGRLILCDALTYTERFKPAVVVDIATLTGACVIALGNHRSGLFSADDALAAELLAAGDAALDPCWRMPVDEDYDEGLKSNFADMANIGGRAGGAITAAMFLKRFTSKLRWAHLDIAGTAWKSGAAKGATGRPVGLLTHFVLSQVK
ncbi:leucyl aminopeptidase [Aquincola sp. S2]|uniref:Probable cytosol aminopeptidase n=1 Tax=Pseudaquabacterium terrae TaxID=2732868 RepID=A0ABX2EMK3_9BURK|nr:leucyl aminopeptidase [Aquabacterium terrae]NRF69856.1 leucyl aminopeptidase [Aquabacterium terrae]